MMFFSFEGVDQHKLETKLEKCIVHFQFGAPALVKAFEERKATGRFILHDEEYVPEPE